jgi:hypothetical protein
MENWQALIAAHEPIIGAVIIVYALFAVSSRLDIIASRLSSIHTVLTSTEIGQERVEKRLSEILRKSGGF